MCNKSTLLILQFSPTYIVLPKGSLQDVKDEVKKKIEILGDDGGYILSQPTIISSLIFL